MSEMNIRRQYGEVGTLGVEDTIEYDIPKGRIILRQKNRAVLNWGPFLLCSDTIDVQGLKEILFEILRP